jgi:FkbM family methyltransferase
MSKFLDSVKEGDIVIDCGAFVGKIGNFFVDKGAIVYMFEPSPVLCRRLRKRFKDNDRVIVVNKGVYDKKCKLKLYYHKEYKSASRISKFKYLEGSSIFVRKRNVGRDYFLINAIDLSNFIKKLNCRIKLLKLNIEGSEYAVLDRLIDTNVIHLIDNVIVAFHNKKIDRLKSKHSALKAKAIKTGVYETIIKWKWWEKNKIFLNRIRKEYS